VPPLHPRNRHPGRYDFAKLQATSPALARWIVQTPRNEDSIDFANPEAVKALNRALLQSYYGVKEWNFPEGYLCPGVPGRADYIHHLADLLASSNNGVIPRGDGVHALDIGTGATCIYPIIARNEYGWTLLASDIDPVALESSKRIVDANPALREGVTLKLQPDSRSVLKNVVDAGQSVDIVICNPPFHASKEEAQAGTERKWRNLGKGSVTQLNFGGQATELWCPGGEVAFARTLIKESASHSKNVLWFSMLISKEASLPPVIQALEQARVAIRKTVLMGQGQKTSRFIAWSFLPPAEHKHWIQKRGWKPA